MYPLDYAAFKKFVDQGYAFVEEDLSNPSRYILTINPRGVSYVTVLPYSDTTNKTDYENNYQARKSACLLRPLRWTAGRLDAELDKIIFPPEGEDR